MLGRLVVMVMVIGRGMLLLLDRRRRALSRAVTGYETAETGCKQQAEQDDTADSAAPNCERPDLLSHHSLQIIETTLIVVCSFVRLVVIVRLFVRKVLEKIVLRVSTCRSKKL